MSFEYRSDNDFDGFSRMSKIMASTAYHNAITLHAAQYRVRQVKKGYKSGVREDLHPDTELPEQLIGAI